MTLGNNSSLQKSDRGVCFHSKYIILYKGIPPIKSAGLYIPLFFSYFPSFSVHMIFEQISSLCVISYSLSADRGKSKFWGL